MTDVDLKLFFSWASPCWGQATDLPATKIVLETSRVSKDRQPLFCPSRDLSSEITGQPLDRKYHDLARCCFNATYSNDIETSGWLNTTVMPSNEVLADRD